MLEENTTYSYEEMSAYLGTRNNQGIERKLRNYGVEFTRTRRGATAQYTIKHIADPFKLCAVFDLGFPCNTDIDKLTEYTYYLINDDEFSGWPDERLEKIMTDRGHRVSRQTIAGYRRRYENVRLIDKNAGDYHYYFACGDEVKETDHQTYKDAWAKYWRMKDSGSYSGYAILELITEYGGVPRKQKIGQLCAWSNVMLTSKLNSMVCKRFEKMCASQPTEPKPVLNLLLESEQASPEQNQEKSS